jgi:hypothetical protein
LRFATAFLAVVCAAAVITMPTRMTLLAWAANAGVPLSQRIMNAERHILLFIGVSRA